MSFSATLRNGLRSTSIAAVILIFSLPAVAGEIYSWRTEDGGYAFTDDEKAIPPRYRDQVETRKSEGLRDYPRLTAPDPGASDSYAERLADRLDSLRALNRSLDAAAAPRPAQAGLDSLAIQTGHFNIGVPLDGAGDGPLVIEKVRFRKKSEMATRHNMVVRKGDEVLAIIEGNPLVSEINQAPDISEMVE